MKRETWKMVIQLVVSILTAIATTLGVTSCMYNTLLHEIFRIPVRKTGSFLC